MGQGFVPSLDTSPDLCVLCIPGNTSRRRRFVRAESISGGVARCLA